MNVDYESYRQRQTKLGLEFQDFIMERMHLIGTVLQPLCSRSGQIKGENLLGMEIKFTPRMQEYDGLPIEVAEKARPREGDYVPSGIMRSDNTWLYGIGNRLVFYIFAKSSLKNCWAKLDQYGLRKYTKDTSLGFVLPLAKAEKMYARKIVFDLQGAIKSVLVGGEESPVDLRDIPVPKSFQLSLI